MRLSIGSVFVWGTLGRPLTYLVLEAAAFFVLTLCVEVRIRRGRAALLPAPARKVWARWVESPVPAYPSHANEAATGLLRTPLSIHEEVWRRNISAGWAHLVHVLKSLPHCLSLHMQDWGALVP